MHADARRPGQRRKQRYRPWRAASADPLTENEHAETIELDADNAIEINEAEIGIDPAEAQMLEMAASRAQLLWRLVRADPRARHPTARIARARFMIVTDATPTCTRDAATTRLDTPIESAHAEIEFASPDGRETMHLEWPLDVALLGDPQHRAEWPAEAAIAIAPDATIGVEALAGHLMRGYFIASEQAGADAERRELESAHTAARERAIGALQGPAAACRARLRDALRRKIAPLVPARHILNARIGHGQIALDLDTEPPTENQP